MIPNKHHHYKTFETFLGKKFSADPGDTTYTYGGEGEIYQGEPDISWRSIVYIKDVRFFATHGRVYDASGKSDSLKVPVLINGTSFDGSEDIVTSKWGETREISIESGRPIKVDGGGDIVLPVPSLLDTKVTKDSLGRVITETYPTNKDLQDAIDELTTFCVYSSDDDEDPELTTSPASEWVDQETRLLHSGDYYVTTSGRVFIFEENPKTGWGWKEITDYYLYSCQSELRELNKKVDNTGAWELTQTFPETGEIYVNGKKSTNPYLDILCCTGSVNYSLLSNTPIYLPFVYGGTYTRTRTKYFRSSNLLRAVDMARVSGKIITITNEEGSIGTITLFLGNSPTESDVRVDIEPGQSCILKFKSDIQGGNLVYYWEASEVCGLGQMRGWV